LLKRLAMKNLIWILAVSLAPLPTHADSRSAYFDALKLAQSKIERSQHRGGSPGALSTSLLGQFLGRPYRTGDTWKVAVWAKDSSIMRQTSEPDKMNARQGRGGIFQYEVTAARSQEVDLRVTQLDAAGAPVIDPRVKSIQLRVSAEGGGFTPVSKVYQFTTGRKDFTASAEGVHAPVSYLELLPLEAPDLTTALRSEVTTTPELPAELRAMGATLSIDPATSAHFEQDDFFGRSVEAIWRQGDPWPVYLKSANGVAVLIVGNSGGVSQ
jgi:hypothetical protein